MLKVFPKKSSEQIFIKKIDYNFKNFFVQVHTYPHGIHLVPEVGSIVTCCVQSVNPVQATLSILAVDDSILHQEFQGVIKKLNVRQHQVDMVIFGEYLSPKLLRTTY